MKCGRGREPCRRCGGGSKNQKASSRDVSRNRSTRTSREDVARDDVTVPRDVFVLRLYLTLLRDVVSLPFEPGAGILPKDGPAQERVPALYTRPVSFPRFTTRVTLQRGGMSHRQRACVCIAKGSNQECHLHPSGWRPSCCAPWLKKATSSPPPFNRKRFRSRSPDATSSGPPRPAPGRRRRSCCRSCSGCRRTARSTCSGRWSWWPHASSPSRCYRSRGRTG